MKKLSVIILLAVATVSCFATSKKSAKKNGAAPAITSIKLQRTACYGRCPEYSIEISKDGSVVYTAVRFNEDTGIFKKNIGTKKAKAIFDEFASYRVDTCRERYELTITDLPGLIYTIKYPGRTQRIINANFGPPFLKTLAEHVDEAGKKTGTGWKKTGMPKLD